MLPLLCASAILVALTAPSSAIASQTVLCEVASEACGEGETYARETPLRASADDAAIAMTVGEHIRRATCNESNFEGETTAQSGAPLPLELSAWSFSNCALGESQCTASALGVPGSGSFDWIEGNSGAFALTEEAKAGIGLVCEDEAHQPRLEAESYPVALGGTGLISFKVGVGKVNCEETELDGPLTDAAAGQQLTAAFSGCTATAYKFPTTVSANSCGFSLHVGNAGPPYAGRLDLSCAEEGDAIEYRVFNNAEALLCSFDVGPRRASREYRSRAPAAAPNAPSTSKSNPKESIRIPGRQRLPGIRSSLRRRAQRLGGAGGVDEADAPVGVFAAGEEIPLGVYLAGEEAEDEAHQPRLEAESYPVTLGGTGLISFKVGVGKVNCEETELDGPLTDAAAGQQLTAAFSGCTATAYKFPTTVSANSCGFSLHVGNAGPPYAGRLDLSCAEEGDAIEYRVFNNAEALLCSFDVGPQTGLAGSIALEHRQRRRTRRRPRSRIRRSRIRRSRIRIPGRQRLPGIRSSLRRRAQRLGGAGGGGRGTRTLGRLHLWPRIAVRLARRRTRPSGRRRRAAQREREPMPRQRPALLRRLRHRIATAAVRGDASDWPRPDGTADENHRKHGADRRSSPYTGSSVTIEPGVRVHVQPGAEVKLSGNLTSKGTLDVAGTTEEPVVFTSKSDSAPGQWSGIKLQSGAGASKLEHAEIRYATTGIAVSGGISPTIAHDVVHGSSSTGITASGGDTKIIGNILSGGPTGITATGDGSPVIAENTIEDCTGYGISRTLGGNNDVGTVSIHDNVVERCGSSNKPSIYVLAQEYNSQLTGVTLAHNTVADGNGRAIQFSGSPNDIVPPDIDENTITGNASNAIWIGAEIAESTTWRTTATRSSRPALRSVQKPR